MNRVCNSCKLELSLDSYHNCKNLPLGKTYTCKPCAKLRSIKWNSDNKEKKKVQGKLHYEDNKEVYKQKAKELAWAKHNPEKSRDRARKRYEGDPSIYFKTVAMRRKRVKQATPTWLSHTQIDAMQDMYVRCATVTKLTGNKHHVDHIVPLKGINVCGLHVPWNLRIIPAEMNIAKSNTFLEDYSTKENI